MFARSLIPVALGAARTAQGDALLAAGDYLEALRHYDSAIDPNNPDIQPRVFRIRRGVRRDFNDTHSERKRQFARNFPHERPFHPRNNCYSLVWLGNDRT